MSDFKSKSLVDGKGVLFTNHDKIDEASPDMKGELFYNGELLRIAGWIVETKKGVLISIGIDKLGKKNYGN